MFGWPFFFSAQRQRFKETEKKKFHSFHIIKIKRFFFCSVQFRFFVPPRFLQETVRAVISFQRLFCFLRPRRDCVSALCLLSRSRFTLWTSLSTFLPWKYSFVLKNKKQIQKMKVRGTITENENQPNGFLIDTEKVLLVHSSPFLPSITFS